MKRFAFVLTAMMFVVPVAFAQEQGQGDAGTSAAPDVEKLPFTRDSVKMVVEYHQPQIQACYEQILATRKKPFEGRLMTSWTITVEVLVKDAKVLRQGSTIREPKLNDCVVAVISSMTFPKPKRPTPIEYPFNLKAIK